MKKVDQRPYLGWTLIVLVLFWGRTEVAHCDIIFEGYSKIILSQIHVGYVIQRYEYFPKKKEFASTYYVKTNARGGNITESLKARSTKSLKPISYQFTRKDSSGVTLIDATFKKGIMKASVTQKGKTTQIEQRLQKGTFLSTFLLYLMLQNKNGLKPGIKYDYRAIAEEDGSINKGEAFVLKEVNREGQKVLKVLNTFKNIQFVSFVNQRGEVLETLSPAQALATKLTPSIQAATQNVAFPKKTLKILFGQIPIGKHSLIKGKVDN